MRERLTFRPTVDGDADTFLDAVRSNADHLLPWVTTPHRITDLETARSSVCERLPAGWPARYGAFSGEVMVASAKVIPCDLSVPDYEVGFWCREQWGGRGVGKWVLGETVAVLFRHGANRVTLRHAASNLRSARVIGRTGAVAEGVLRSAARVGDRLDDVAVYGILREEWTPGRGADWREPWKEF